MKFEQFIAYLAIVFLIGCSTKVDKSSVQATSVAPVSTQVETVRIDVLNASQGAAIDHLLQLQDGGVVPEEMADH